MKNDTIVANSVLSDVVCYKIRVHSTLYNLDNFIKELGYKRGINKTKFQQDQSSLSNNNFQIVWLHIKAKKYTKRSWNNLEVYGKYLRQLTSGLLLFEADRIVDNTLEDWSIGGPYTKSNISNAISGTKILFRCSLSRFMKNMSPITRMKL